jgi:hypothetical protein
MNLLLAQLVNIRFNADESASGFCLRLHEIFEDLEMVPGSSSIQMNDPQKIGYLLTGIRQEKQLQAVYVALQEKQGLGTVTFEEACDALHTRCDAIRADEMLNTPVRGQSQKALISTHGKKLNKDKGPALAAVLLELCLEKDCLEMIKAYLPLCGLHYHECISAKRPEMILKENYGTAKFNSATQKIDYPATVPKDRFPLPGSARPRKGLMMFPPQCCVVAMGPTTDISLGDPNVLTEENGDVIGPFLPGGPGEMRFLVCKPSMATSTFYVDSGAGQRLSFCSAAFQSLEPCHIEVVGVAGSLSIFGIGTAMLRCQ